MKVRGRREEGNAQICSSEGGLRCAREGGRRGKTKKGGKRREQGKERGKGSREQGEEDGR